MYIRNQCLKTIVVEEDTLKSDSLVGSDIIIECFLESSHRNGDCNLLRRLSSGRKLRNVPTLT